LKRTLTVLALIGLLLISLPTSVAGAGSNALGACPEYSPAANQWGVRVSVYEHNWSGINEHWCPKWDPIALGFSWDGDNNFNTSDMTWLDIGDGEDMNGLTSTYSIIVAPLVPTAWYCVTFYHMTNYTYSSLDLPLDVVFKHTQGTKNAIHGQLNLYHNDSFRSVRIDYSTNSASACNENY